MDKPVIVGMPLADIKNHPNAFSIVNTDMHGARWAVAYHTNSHSPRARRWYRIIRIIYVDSRWFELYWHPALALRGNDRAAVRKAAEQAGLNPLPGLFTSKPGGAASEMQS